MLYKSILLVALMSTSVAFAATTTMYYYDDHDDGYWNLPAANDFYVQGYDPGDFGVTSAYTVTEVGIWTSASYTQEDGSGLCSLFLLYLDTKESHPDGVPHEYDESDMELYWYVSGDELNTHTVDWDVPAGQCLGLGVIGQDPWIEDFVICTDTAPASDTADWEYYLTEWLDLEVEGYEMDFAFQLEVEHSSSAIESASLGSIKAAFK